MDMTANKYCDGLIFVIFNYPKVVAGLIFTEEDTLFIRKKRHG
jgi:hypothetical protein